MKDTLFLFWSGRSSNQKKCLIGAIFSTYTLFLLITILFIRAGLSNLLPSLDSLTIQKDLSTTKIGGILGGENSIKFVNGDQTHNEASINPNPSCCRSFRDGTFAAPASKETAKLLEKLKDLPAVYNRPTNISLGSSTPFQLVIQTAQSQEPLTLFREMPGEPISVDIKAAQQMSARLTFPPDKLEATLRGPPKRLVTAQSPVSWIWDVKGLKPGPANVTLEIFAHLTTKDDDAGVAFRVYTDKWTVKTSPLEWIKYQIGEIEPVYKFTALALAGLGSFLAWFGLKPAGKEEKEAEE